MKFLHLGDLHLGKSLGEFDLYDDQDYILKQFLELIRQENVDAVLIAGDVYDKAIPSENAVTLLDQFLCSLAAMHVNVFMISGNHDSDDRLHFGSDLFTSNGIYISAIYNGELTKHTLRDEFGEIDIWLLPFVKASRVRHFYPNEKISSYDDACRLIIEKANIDRSRRNVIVSHQFVGSATQSPVLSGSESAGTKNVGLVEIIGYDCFDAFDYAALGHIHSPQRVGRDEVRYAGSPLKYSLSEANNQKTVPIITIGMKGDTKIELVPLRPMRDLRHIRGTMAQLLDDQHVTDNQDFIYATLTDEDIINDAMGIFRTFYPNTVQIDYDNSHSRAIEQVDIANIANHKSFEELISDFYRQIYSCDMTDEEMAVMKAAAREAGVIHEAD